MNLILFKPYELLLHIHPTEGRTFDDFVALVVGAPKDSVLCRSIAVDRGHSERYPRIAVEFDGPVSKGFRVRVLVEERQSADEVATELGAVLAKNGWLVG